MVAKVPMLVASLVGLLICCTAGAQVRSSTASTTSTGSTTAQRPVRHAKLASRPATNPAGQAPTAAASSQQAGAIQIPPSGLVSSEFVSNNLSRPVHPDGRHGKTSFTPILFWGYPFYYSGDAADDQADPSAAQPAQAQPQVIVSQQPAPGEQAADSAGDAGNAPAPLADADAAKPDPDAGNFILVRRDGRILFAAIFSVVGTQLQYVTPEGIRRTLEMVELDAGATEQMNEARGTLVQFRN